MNCKPGDLAIVIRSRHPANVGLIVQVLHAYQTGEKGILSLDKGHLWLCTTAGSPLLMTSAWGVGVHRLDTCPIPDDCLRPLPPEQNVDDTSDCVVKTQHIGEPVAA
jgi:hypothetical protein